MILGIIYLIVAEKLAEWIKMGYGLYEFYSFSYSKLLNIHPYPETVS